MNIVDEVNRMNETRDRIATALLLILVILVGLFGFVALSAVGSYECDTAMVVVEEGDTLWSLVERHCSGNTRSVIEDMARDSNLIFPGDRLSFPKP